MARMEQVSLMELGKLAAEGQIEAEVFAQIAQCAQKMTKGNKPYLDVSFADAEGTMGLKVWEDKPWFRTLASLPLRSFVSLRGNGCFPLVLDSMLLPGVAAVFFTCALHGGACRCPGDVGRRISFRV